MVSFESHKAWLKTFCEEFDWPSEAYIAHDEALDALMGNEKYFGYINTYFADGEISLWDAVQEMKKDFADFKVASETVQMLFFVLISRHLKERYKKAGIDEAIWYRSVLDLKAKLIECKNVRNIWGSFVADWFCGFFNLTRFALGRLQYEIINIPEIKREENKLYTGKKSINIHIPGIGPLLPEDVEESLKMATEFYADEFEGDEVLFHCGSWLLFPEHREFLPEHSRILQFMDFFTIIDSGYHDDGNDLWRIFNTDQKDVDKFPADTSLQRAYIAWLKAGNKPGWGRGIIRMKKHPR